MRNTGKPSEEKFDETWQRQGKSAFVFKFTDAAEATGMNKGAARRGAKVINIKAQPSDRLLVDRGRTEFAEVKSTTDPRNFTFKLLRTTQSAFAAMVLAAGGTYQIYVHRLDADVWYRVPYPLIQQTKDAGRASMSWAELDTLNLRWEHPCLTPM